jgi:hypothetical protein
MQGKLEIEGVTLFKVVFALFCDALNPKVNVYRTDRLISYSGRSWDQGVVHGFLLHALFFLVGVVLLNLTGCHQLPGGAVWPSVVLSPPL